MGNPMNLAFQQLVEQVVTFSMKNLAEHVWPYIEGDIRVAAIIPHIKSLTGLNYQNLRYSIIRNSFLIELVKTPGIESTKFRVRWANDLINDPRYCSFDECLWIAIDLLNSFPIWFQNKNHAEVLNLSFAYSLLPYESPIEYNYRLTNDHRIHQRGNVIWYSDDLILKTLKLRKYLLDQATSPDQHFFTRVLKDKIKVKTYLTDRVLTGLHKTNREKRWETHPYSVHFAERRVCIAIEYALVTQICKFDGFPEIARQQLQNINILPQILTIALCPITGDALSYQSFRDGLLNPTHGKSDFQVGHLNPLKLGLEGSALGHTSDNISWISADGNRIQGSLSLDSVRALIQRIAQNYNNHKWWPT